MVVHVITSLGVGGAEMMLSKIVIGRKKQNLNDAVICLTSRNKIGDLLEAHNVHVHYLNISSLTTLFKSLFTLNRLLKNYNPDIVQTWLYHADFIGGIIAKLRRIKVVWNIRQTKFTSMASLTTIIIMRICAVLSYIVPDQIICAANASLLTHSRFGYSRRKLLVIPNGFIEGETIDKQLINQKKRELNIRPDELVVGTVGRFHHDKDYLTFVRAASTILQKHPKTKFLMVGRNLDENNQTLKGWLIEEDIVENFVLTGETANVNMFLSTMDIFCLSSISEGFPNVVGEAMLKGIPCVVTDSGDSKYVIADAGHVVDVKSPLKLAMKIIEVMELNDLDRKILGHKAQNRILQNFMLDKIVEDYSSLYHQLSNK